MYTNFNQEVHSTSDASTKYTEYLKSVKDGSFFEDRAVGRRVRASNGSNRPQQQRQQGHPFTDNEVKFSNIFSPQESNALKLQLLQKTSSLPLLEQDQTNNSNTLVAGEGGVDAVVEGRRRRSSAGPLVHYDHDNNNNTRKGESVANILYSTIRHGHDYDNPSADETLHTGSDSKVDYDPHEPLPAVDQLALRHELLNNIRAISRATYFEDLYTGKVRHNSGSPEAEVLQLLQNSQEAAAVPAETRTTIPSKDASLSRVDRWVQESSEASSHPQNQDTDEDKQNQNSSLYHQSVWEENKNKRQGRHKPNKKGRKDRITATDGSNTESDDVDTASGYLTRGANKGGNPPPNSNPNISDDFRNANVNMHDSINPSKAVGVAGQYLHSNRYLRPNQHEAETESSDRRRPFSFGLNSSSDDLVPLSISLPNVAQQNPYLSSRSTMHGLNSSYNSFSVSRPENLNHSVSTKPTFKQRNDKVKKKETTNNDEQVRRIVQRKPAPVSLQPRHQQRLAGGSDGPGRGAAVRGIRYDRNKAPALYTRLNINQWVLKKIWFYVNGDEHVPRFEYRFRHGKDIRDWDQLLDILTKRFPSLPTGARHIFTMDGYQINGLDELVNENSYLVSSTRKLKTLKYTSRENYEITGAHDKRTLYVPSKSHGKLSRVLSASDGNLNLRDRKPVQTNPKKSLSSLNSKSTSDVTRLVSHVIHEASGNASPMIRQPIRIINGSNPSLQSQVLLNTKTSQPFEDLVADLAMSVRIPKQPVGNRLQTVSGREITSYSQLRSELKAGQRAFYAYSKPSDKDNKESHYLRRATLRVSDGYDYDSMPRYGKPFVKATLGKVNSNSSSDLSDITENIRRERRRYAQNRRRSHTPTCSPHCTPKFSNTYQYSASSYIPKYQDKKT